MECKQERFIDAEHKMKCEEPNVNCQEESVGKDIQGWNLCQKHLDFSIWVQRMCNKYLDLSGHPELVPDEFRLEDENVES